MFGAVDSCVAACSWKLYGLIRARRLRADAEFVGFSKAHVLSYLEYRAAAIYHASSSVLSPLGAILTRFLRSLNISSEDALFYFNLAPLSTRWDISILG
eukprot:3531724-Pyramimonas_sp.AAC.1